jgi:hypothetical protein
LNWQENLTEEDMPPRHIWRDNDRLEAHFAALKNKYKSDKDPYDAPAGTFDDAMGGHRVLVKNRLGDYVRESLNQPWDDFSEF